MSNPPWIIFDKYELDLIQITCKCPHFKFRTSYYPQGDSRRLCKHLARHLKEIELYQRPIDKSRKPRVEFQPLIDMLAIVLDSAYYHQVISGFAFAGSWRREVSMVADLDVLVICSKEQFAQFLDNLSQVDETLWRGVEKCSVRMLGIQVDFRRVPDIESWVTMLMYFTGSKAENIRLRSKAIKLGMKLNEYGLWMNQERIPAETEQQVYALLGEKYVQPQNR